MDPLFESMHFAILNELFSSQINSLLHTSESLLNRRFNKGASPLFCPLIQHNGRRRQCRPCMELLRPGYTIAHLHVATMTRIHNCTYAWSYYNPEINLHDADINLYKVDITRIRWLTTIQLPIYHSIRYMAANHLPIHPSIRWLATNWIPIH